MAAVRQLSDGTELPSVYIVSTKILMVYVLYHVFHIISRIIQKRYKPFDITFWTCLSSLGSPRKPELFVCFKLNIVKAYSI